MFSQLNKVLAGAVLVLILCVLFLGQRIKVLNAALAARPKVEIHTETQTKTVRVAGPVHIETKTVYVPGTKEVQYVDRIVVRDPVTTTTDKQVEMDKKITPACAAAPTRRIEVTSSPLNVKAIGVNAAMTAFQVLDLSTGYEFYGDGHDRIRVGLGFRF